MRNSIQTSGWWIKYQEKKKPRESEVQRKYRETLMDVN
jgi:hypothetical protein